MRPAGPLNQPDIIIFQRGNRNDIDGSHHGILAVLRNAQIREQTTEHTESTKKLKSALESPCSPCALWLACQVKN
jgi:hypothetical protein